MCVCIYIYMYLSIYIYTDIYICVYIYMCVCVKGLRLRATGLREPEGIVIIGLGELKRCY